MNRHGSPAWFWRAGLRGLGWVALVGAIAIALVVAGNELGQLVLALLVLIAVSASLTGLVAFLLLPLRGLRPAAQSTLAFTSVFVAGAVGVLLLSVKLHAVAFTRVAKRLDPVIVAIQAYDEDHGQPPEFLKSLVPTYLERLPSTGSKIYPVFEYFVPEASLQGEKAGPGDSGGQHGPYKLFRWELRIPSTGLWSWNYYAYWPSEDYPESFARMGKWGQYLD